MQKLGCLVLLLSVLSTSCIPYYVPPVPFASSTTSLTYNNVTYAMPSNWPGYRPYNNLHAEWGWWRLFDNDTAYSYQEADWYCAGTNHACQSMPVPGTINGVTIGYRGVVLYMSKAITLTKISTYSNSFGSYQIIGSNDGTTYDLLASGTVGFWQGWTDLVVSPVPTKKYKYYGLLHLTNAAWVIQITDMRFWSDTIYDCAANTYFTGSACSACPANYSQPDASLNFCELTPPGYYNMPSTDILTSNMIAHYSFWGTNRLQDGTGITGPLTAVNGPTYRSDSSGPWAYSEYGNTDKTVSSYFTIPAVSLSPTSFSICAWIKFASLSDYWPTPWVLASAVNEVDSLRLTKSNTGTTLSFSAVAGSTQVYGFNFASAITLNWRHICVVKASTWTMYDNGVVDTSTPTVTSGTDINNVVRSVNYFGRDSYSTGTMGTVSIDDFRIYNVALTASQVSALYGLRNILPCQPGSYSATGGATSSTTCIGCPSAMYQPAAASSSCTTCPAGCGSTCAAVVGIVTTTSNRGSTVLDFPLATIRDNLRTNFNVNWGTSTNMVNYKFVLWSQLRQTASNVCPNFPAFSTFNGTYSAPVAMSSEPSTESCYANRNFESVTTISCDNSGTCSKVGNTVVFLGSLTSSIEAATTNNGGNFRLNIPWQQGTGTTYNIDLYLGVVCDPGQYGDGARCTPCPPGAYAAAGGSISCVCAAAGTYQPNSSATATTTCPVGTTSSVIGATSLATCVVPPCSSGYVAVNGSCQLCAIGICTIIIICLLERRG